MMSAQRNLCQAQGWLEGASLQSPPKSTFSGLFSR